VRGRATVKPRLPSVAIPELLQALLEARGPSGYEVDASRVWRDAAATYGEVTSDVLGSSYVRVPGGDAPTLAVLGHIDEIGLIVTHVDEKGFLAVRRIGGFSAEVVVGQRVTVMTRSGEIRGVVARRTAKTQRDEKPNAADVDDLDVDIGARDADEARSMVRQGDAMVLDGMPFEIPNRRVVSRALDNRVGSFVALEVARLVAEAGSPPSDVVAGALTQEEIGGFAARAGMTGLRPDVAIVFDVTATNDVPGADPRDDGEHPLGSGAAILRGPTMNPRVVDLLLDAAEEEGIPYTVEVAARVSQTDADEIHNANAGIPTAVVSIPLRYMHSPIEMVQLDDVEACARLAAAFARRLGPDSSFDR
jgi:putative aminopeptidase FrvX